MAWNPADTRALHGLSISESQRAKIAQNFAPLTPDQFLADMVFEGGGVLGTAFLGALRCCHDAGVRTADVAGTSAGAITAALVGVGHGIDQLEEIFSGLDYKSFLSKKTNFLILTGDPSDDMGDDIGRLISGLVLTRQQGEYSTEPFRAWISQRLAAIGVNRFADLPPIQRVGDAAPSRRSLKVVAADISGGIMVVLPDSLQYAPYRDEVGPDPNAYAIADAVRLSMSIPLFFEPTKLGGNTIVDGGVTSNFPLWLFDSPPNQQPPYPTFGFRLVDKEPAPTIPGAIDVLKGLLTTVRYAHDRFYLQAKDLGRVINIDVTAADGFQVTATKFNLSDDDKAELYRRGYVATRNFLVDLDGKGWNWRRHLLARGFANQHL
ncbi:MAG: patatin-like phospholipase family protein [Isosphaeraceae bacterium]